MARLGDVCSIRSSNHSADKDKNWLLNLDVVEQQTGRVLEYFFVPESGLDGSIISFDTDNVLYSKLRPNLNKVVIPEKNGYATSEMLPLYPDTKQITREYLACYLRSPGFVEWAVSKTAGAKMPRLGTKELLNKEIPLPSVDLQKRIAKVLFLIDSLISLRKKQLQKLDDLVKSRFVEMFGDPETNPKGWKKVTVGDVCSSIVRGPFGSALKKEFFVEPNETTYKVYEQKHAIQKSATIGSYYVTTEKYAELERFKCIPGDIIMSCSGTMGELYQLPEGCERGIINQALCKFTLNDRMLPICFLTYMRQTIGNLDKKGSGIQNIAAVSFVKAMPINLPPMEIQEQFEAFAVQIDKSRSAVQRALDEAQLLFDSLMQKYFG